MCESFTLQVIEIGNKMSSRLVSALLCLLETNLYDFITSFNVYDRHT